MNGQKNDKIKALLLKAIGDMDDIDKEFCEETCKLLLTHNGFSRNMIYSMFLAAIKSPSYMDILIRIKDDIFKHYDEEDKIDDLKSLIADISMIEDDSGNDVVAISATGDIGRLYNGIYTLGLMRPLEFFEVICHLLAEDESPITLEEVEVHTLELMGKKKDDNPETGSHQEEQNT